MPPIPALMAVFCRVLCVPMFRPVLPVNIKRVMVPVIPQGNALPFLLNRRRVAPSLIVLCRGFGVLTTIRVIIRP